MILKTSGASRRERANVCQIAVIACDKRKAFAQGSGATKQSIRPLGPLWIASPRSQRRFSNNHTGFPAYGIDAVSPPSTGIAWPLT